MKLVVGHGKLLHDTVPWSMLFKMLRFYMLVIKILMHISLKHSWPSDQIELFGYSGDSVYDLILFFARYPANPGLVSQVTCDPATEPHMPNLGNFVESDHDSAASPTDVSSGKSTTDSKALVAVPAMSVEALAVIPAHRKSKRSEAAQRRIRRPFSVTEVEALVHAVEKLGTGRYV